jgi:organic hydroperoxide reductase OsmC/OhrA
MSNESAVDPEEAFVAALSSCHMLWFLSVAVEKNYIVDSYEDNAAGRLGKNKDGKLAMTKVTLKPRVTFNSKTTPSREQVDELHRLAHGKCFIANSVKTAITILQP